MSNILWKNALFLTLFLSLLSSVCVQASTITLKDGRSVTGDIVQQDKTKVVLKNGDIPLTYYKDEIVSIVEGPVVNQQPSPVTTPSEPDINIPVDTNKLNLINQYMKINATEDLVNTWIGNAVPIDQKDRVLSILDKNLVIQKIEEIRRQSLMKHLTLEDIKAAMNFFSSPEGVSYLQHMKDYNDESISPMRKMAREEAIKVMNQPSQ